jgi:peptide-methionine (S)-S-oxide reductase
VYTQGVNYLRELFSRGKKKDNGSSSIKKAYFGMGCFWSPQYNFSSMPGVLDTRVGYAGGKAKNPTYTSLGDHTEIVEVTYDENQLSYDTLLESFWGEYDPTTPHKRQYRSVILYQSPEELRTALRSLEKEQEKYVEPILTDVEPLETFYEAEEYHQHYIKKQSKKHGK